MQKPKLYYFDAPVSRGEECRLALHCAGVEFEDVRWKRDQWLAEKPNTPFGSAPIFELPGKPKLAQSNAILAYIGREHDLHPKDAFEAARHEAMMAYVEDLRHAISPSLRMSDEAEKKKTREALAATTIPDWAARAEKQIGDGPFFGGAKLNVVDLKIHMVVKWIAGGALDHIPATAFASSPKVVRVHDAVRDDARVKAWYAKK